MTNPLTLGQKLQIVRAVWPHKAHKSDGLLSFELLEVEAVLCGGNNVVGGEKLRTRIVEEAKKVNGGAA